MPFEDEFFEENVKKSFRKVKKHMDDLDNTIASYGKELKDLKNQINLFRREIAEIKKIKDSSIGNEGVDDMMTSYDDMMMISDDHTSHSSKVVNQASKSKNLDKSKPFLSDLEHQFEILTDREKSVFFAIYDLEQQYDGVSYFKLAEALNISDITIRRSVISLLEKGLPIEKRRLLNGKVSLFIKKEFRDLYLAEKSIKIKEKQDKFTTFSDD